MSPYELLATVLACFAILVSVISWNGQRRLQREANDLQRATSELAKRQLEILNREERGKQTARISVQLFKDGRTYRFRISNVGEADAANVSMRLLLQRDGDNPIIASEYADKFPVKRLAPGASLTLIAAIHLGGPSAYNAVVSWTNPDGSQATEELFVSL